MGFMLEREKVVMGTVFMIVQGCIWPVKMGWLASLSPYTPSVVAIFW
jgi:hypothetical protein